MIHKLRPMSWRLIAACATLVCGVAWGQDAREQYVLHSLKAAGDVAGGNLRLKIETRAEATTDGLARIPLRLDEAILTDHSPPADAQQYVKDEGSRGGYAWYLRGKGEPHQLSLDVMVPLRETAGETQLRLSFPQAQQAISELKLRIPGDVAVGELLGGELLEDPQRRNGQTDLTLRRLAGPLTVSWYPRGQVVRESGKLRARTFARARYDAPAREFRTDARITVLSTGGTFSEFQLRLPPGATLAEDNLRGLKVERATDGRGDLVKVKHEPTARYVLALSLVQPYDPGGKAVELAKYEVMGAVRQWGFVALDVDDNHQARWSPLDPRHISRIAAADLPREFLEEMKLVPDDADGAFEVFSPQASLVATCTRSKARVRVEADQVVFVQRDRLRLEAILRYTTDRPVNQVQFDLPLADDWQDVEVTSVRPSQVVQPLTADSFTPRAATGRREVTVDLKPGVGNSFTLHVTALRKRAAESDTVALGVLQAQGQAMDGRLWIQPADEVSLTPLEGVGAEKEKAKDRAGSANAANPKTVGLSLLPFAPPPPEEVKRQGFKQPYVCYRVESPGATFAARWGSHPQRVSTSSKTDLTLETGRAGVEQWLRAEIEHQPLTEFLLDVPADVEGGLQVDASLDGKALSGRLSLVEGTADGPALHDRRPKRLMFANPVRPGKLTLHLLYGRPWSAGSQRGGGRETVVVPLVVPLTGEVQDCRLSLAAKDGLSLRLAGASADAFRPTAEAGVAVASRPVPEVAVEATWGAPVIRRLWITSWLDHDNDKRIDELTCEFTSDRHSLRLQLPAGAGGTLQTWLDKDPWPPAFADKDLLEVPPARGARTLKVLYEVPAQCGRLTTWIDPARPTEDAWVHETYWQLILLPETRHLLWSPANLQREFAWEWQGFGWGRQNRQASNLGGSRGYLFSTLGSPPSVRVATMDRTWLVLIASGLSFFVGGLVLRVSWLRRREAIFIGVVLLAAFALAWPEPAALVVQSASLGLAAIVVVLILKRLFAVYRPLVPGRLSGSTLSSSGVYRGRGSSAPTRLSPNGVPAGMAGSSRASTGTISPNPSAAQGTAPMATESASAGSGRPSGHVAAKEGALEA